MRTRARLPDVAPAETPELAREEAPEIAAEVAAEAHARFGNTWVQASLAGTGDALAEYVRLGMTLATEGVEPGLFSSNQAMLAVMRAANEADREPAAAPPPGAGARLPPAIAARMSAALGHTFEHVRIHADGPAARYADGLGAHAVAVGDHLYFGAGELQPGTPEGDALLLHELTHVIQHDEGRQHGGGVSRPQDPLEREAYAAEALVEELPAPDHVEEERGTNAQAGPALSLGTPVASAPDWSRSPQNPGFEASNPLAPQRSAAGGLASPATLDATTTVGQLCDAAAARADWFSGLSDVDRESFWKVLLLTTQQPAMRQALEPFRVMEIAALPDFGALRLYGAAFDPATTSVRLATPARSLAHAIQIGEQLRAVEPALPEAVLHVVLPVDGFYWLVETNLLEALVAYYAMFTPTLEREREWPGLVMLLLEGMAPYVSLQPWIHDLHMFTVVGRAGLVANFADHSRTRPLTLMLVAASDYNGAFFLRDAIDDAINDPNTLTLVIQGAATLDVAGAQVEALAAEYGQRTAHLNPAEARYEESGVIAQVVFVGHGSPRVVELAGAPSQTPVEEDGTLLYADQDLQVGDVDTGELFDVLLRRSPPAGPNIVFLSCTVGAEDIDSSELSGSPADAREALERRLREHPNLATVLRRRVAEVQGTGVVVAGRPNLVTDDLELVDGRATLARETDPALTGSALDYLERGTEPAEVLRAAAACLGDPTIDPAEVRGVLEGYRAQIGGGPSVPAALFRGALSLALQAGLHPGRLIELSKDLPNWETWLTKETADPRRLGASLRSDELDVVLGTVRQYVTPKRPFLPIVLEQAWLQHDAAHTSGLIAALDGDLPPLSELHALLDRGVIDTNLPALLVSPLIAGSLRLALAVALADGASMPMAARDLLLLCFEPGETTLPRRLAAHVEAADHPRLLEALGVLPSSEVAPAEPTFDAHAEDLPPGPHLVRDAPDANAAILGISPDGAPLHASGTQDGWWIVDFYGERGYVMVE